MTHPKLDRIPCFDERSRNYGVRRLLATRPVKRKPTAWVPWTPPLDQGREGACVGFAWAHELGCTPVPVNVSDNYARMLYQAARSEDRLMGNDFPEGASLLAGAKSCQALGLIKSYYWAFSVDDVIDALVAQGPVVLGLPWYSGMYQTDKDGMVDVTGHIVGGHALLATGYVPDAPNGDLIVWQNSWGPDYGNNGQAFIHVDDLKRLLAQDGEACVATDVSA
ncbi:hypothetical protein GCM10012275_28550 [Longimycelium tulufanense]|uniref:Peptidase C1A papain C-terminal domain-containing protein n=1 Tax=Longimycelium tulufanense TaxID=907463 RepID=A0A8J3C8M7_9PSEU|nr:C1 family peptidase [Longimycelium tulufanense]GGM55725.1 hypothetical protein GCM10012275_28550 [Longimycelium tulufanense]